MKRRALVLGAETFGLTGVHHDVETVSETFAQRGFTVDRREGDDATRAGMLDGYEKLISDTRSGDVAVVHYSGHGGMAASAENEVTPQADIQYIVPFDMDRSTPEAFLGISSLELRVLLARLTEHSQNCVVILDCCHAAHMSRDPDLRPRARTHLSYLDVAAHNERLRKEGMEVGLLDAIGNRYAVRLVACGPQESSYEYTNNVGVRTGLLTESFCLALADAGEQRVSWAALARRIRRRVRLIAPTQSPAAEGPSRRFLFEEEEADPTGTLPVVPLAADRISLPGARLAGVVVDDEFAVASLAGERTVFADATVDRVSALTAEAEVTFRGTHTELPADAVARPTRVAARRWPVRVAGTGPVADRLRAAVTEDATLRLPDDTRAPVLATVEVGEALSLSDAAGPLFKSSDTNESGTRQAVGNLAKLARSAALQVLEPEEGEALEDPFSVEWGLVVDGEAQPMQQTGELIHPGDHVYIKLRNEGERAQYFNVVDLAPDSTVSLVLRSDQGGLRLRAAQEYVIGRHENGRLEGIELTWPAIPAGVPRLETVLVIVASADEDLSAVCQDGVRDPVVSRKIEDIAASGSSLQRAMAQAGVGGTRNLSSEKVRTVSKYAVRRLTFLLSPVERPRRENTRFLVDERPGWSMRLARPLSHDSAIVEIRLRELRLDVPGAADRMHVVVVAGGADGVPVWRAKTIRLGAHGESLDVVLDQGEAVGQLDLALWVSTGGDVGGLLREHLDAVKLHEEAREPGKQAAAQPWSAAGAASALVSAALVDAAQRLLSAAGALTPIFRTTLLAEEEFGAGRHPVNGLLHAGFASFSHDIVISRPKSTKEEP